MRPSGAKGTGAGGGVVYVCWGHNSCPSGGAQLVYTGRAGGSHYNNRGGGGNPQCLPLDSTFYKTVVAKIMIIRMYMEQNIITNMFRVLYAMLPPGVLFI